MHSKRTWSYKFAIIMVTLISINLFALDVDVDEIKNSRRIKFLNYSGKHKKIDPVHGVKAIGRKLAQGARRRGENLRFRYHLKYSVVRAISAQEPQKLSADIISIDRNAKVDHIKNIRRIIAAYLVNMYGYSEGSARALALFATYYNAIYRGNLDYFSKKYKKVVLTHINAKNAGISTKYYEWPGKTKLLIPLTKEAVRKQIDAIDPDIISDKKTLDAIRKRGENVDERKELVDIREKKLKKDKKDLKDKKQDLARKERKIKADKRRLAEKKKQTADKKKEITQKEKQVEQDKIKAKKIKDPEKRKEEEKKIAEKEKTLEKEKKQVRDEEKKTAKKEDALKKEEKKTSDSTSEIKKEESKLDKREKEIAEEKKRVEDDDIKRSLKKDPEKADRLLEEKAERLEEKEKELDKREDSLRDETTDKNIFANKFYYLKINEYLQGGHYNNHLYMIDAATRKVLFKSPVENICGRRYDIFSGGIVVIAHRGDHKSGHFLALIDREKLQLKVQGQTNIFWRSFIEIKDGFIYAITWDNGDHHLAKFDKNLKLVAKSKEKIHSDTFITFYDNFIYINDEQKKIMVLKTDDLALIDRIKP